MQIFKGQTVVSAGKGKAFFCPRCLCDFWGVAQIHYIEIRIKATGTTEGPGYEDPRDVYTEVCTGCGYHGRLPVEGIIGGRIKRRAIQWLRKMRRAK